ncbi:MerR family transcriptional regulator [Nocardia sp. NPDC047038]|uniref:MerR family transcriptional regulator n=1 Tax=Nocardia sp. NPDC047038 TaxID=3154338 RepID=UPI0034038388
MKIGEASIASGASPRALRLYEDEGLIVPGRCSNGYRDYCPSTIDRIRVIRHLLDAGLPVRFVKRVLPALIEGAGDLDSQARDEIAAYHDRLTRRIALLERQRSSLGGFLSQAADREAFKRLTFTHTSGSYG